MNHTLGVYTKDFALYYEVLTLLKKRHLSYVSLSSPQHIPSRIKVIITTKQEAHAITFQKTIAADTYKTLDLAIDAALRLLLGKSMYATISIGIDPGDRPGIAVVGDEILLQKTFVTSPEDVLIRVKQLKKEYPSKDTTIRIGHGSPLIRNRIINSLIPLKIPIEIVDESKTTSCQQTQRAQRDKEAAAAIALLKGGRVQQKLPLEPTRGAIRHIQEKSRQLTSGEFTITQEQAKQVLLGSISLQEALVKRKKKKK